MTTLLSGTATPFGTALRHWRTSQGLSQLALSLEAGTTSRHVSFLETGRSRPSRDMVDRLTAALALPLRERNALFVAAGLAPAFRETGLDDDSMADFRRVVDLMLASHDPYPAYAVDGGWNIVRTNRAAERFLPPTQERNVVRLTYDGAWQHLIENWAEIAWLGVERLRADAARFPADPELAGLVAHAMAAVDRAGVTRPQLPSSAVRVLCPQFRIGDEVISTISVVAQFGSPLDVTLEELRIELIYPADERAEDFLQHAAASPME